MPARGLLLLAILLTAVAARAQSPTGSVGGTVRRDDGEPIPGATVHAVNETTGFERTVTTDEAGRYLLGPLPIQGRYVVSASFPGFAMTGREVVTLVSGDTVVFDFTLRVAVAETVDVRLGQPILERRQSTIQQHVDEPLVRSLPLMGRSFLHLASLAAGFTGAADYPNPQGQSIGAHNVLVDGASHFSKWRSAARTFYAGYGLESVRDVQVLTNLFSAEYGDALASVTTVVTKSGTNDWRGSGFLFVRDDAFDARPAFTAVTPPAGMQQFGGTLGGPLVRDRAHLFLSYDGRRARGRNVVVSPEAPGALVPDDQDEHLAFVRADQRFGDRHVLTARYNGQRFRWHREPGGLVLPGSGTAYVNDVHTAFVSEAGQLSSRVLQEFRVQFARYVDRREDLQPAVYVSRAGYAQSGGALGPGGFGADPEDTWEAAGTLSAWLGTHAVKTGAGGRRVQALARSSTYGRGAYFFAGSPAAYPEPYLYLQGVAASPASATAEASALGAFAYVQDDWRVRPGLTLNAGLRYDVEQVHDVRGYDVGVDADNVQPRVGVSWAPRQIDGLVLRGGAGLYTQQYLLYPILRVELEGIDGVRQVALAPGAPQFPSYPAPLAAPLAGLPPTDVYRAGAGLHNPSAVQYGAGAERTWRGTVLAADWVRLLGYDLQSLVDANAPDSIRKPDTRTVAEADRTRPLLPAPGTYRKVLTLGNEGRSWYRALQIKARRTIAPVQVLASYTWSRAVDQANYELPEDSRRLDAERGRAASDVRHNVAVAATWDLPGRTRVLRGWTVAGVGVFRSNRPYTVTWGDDRNGTTQNDARPGDRNTGRTDSYTTIDLAVSRRLRLGGGTGEVRIEAFNLLDVVNFDRYVGELSSPLYARPTAAFPPRRLQLAGIVRF